MLLLLIKEWLGLYGIHPRKWAGLNIQDWWSSLAEHPSQQRKGLTSIALLTVWELWLEQNGRVFRHKTSPTFIVLDKIKCEARLWVLAGAKGLGILISGE
jgi:hypothetical protein